MTSERKSLRFLYRMLKALRIHIWRFHHHSGNASYYQCEICGKRKYRKIYPSFEIVVDTGWLNGGEPSTREEVVSLIPIGTPTNTQSEYRNGQWRAPRAK